jgi:PAS domain S-box-containing protein
LDKHHKKDKEVPDQTLKARPEQNGLRQNYTSKEKGEFVEHFHMVMENMPLIAIQLDLNGNVIYCNQYLTEVSGYTKGEIIGYNVFEKLSPKEYNNKKDEFLGELTEGKLIGHIETPILTKNGEKRLIEWNNTLILDPEGKVIFTTSIGKDITERKLAEEKLRESEAGYRDLIENSNDLICTHDLDGNILSINNSALKTTGYSSEEILKGNLRSIIVPEYQKLFDSYLKRIKETGEAKGKMIIKTKTGEKRIWEYNNTLRKEGIAKPVVRGMVKDVTEQKRAELERGVLYEINNGITSTSNLNELLKLIHQSISQVVYAENCFVALFDEETKLFSFPYFVDKFDPTPEPQALLKSCTAYVFRKGKPLLLTLDVSEKLEAQNEVELIGAPSASWIGVPLKTPTRTIGVLVLQHYEEENAYSLRDVQFLDSVGGQIALVIERKRAEQEIKESELRMRMIVEGTPYLFFYTQDTNAKVTYISPSVKRITGYSEDEWLNQSHWFVTDNPINQIAIETTNAHLSGKFTDGPITLELLHADRHPIHLEVYEYPIIINGVVIGLQGVAHNITERIQTEIIIRQKNEQLQELNATKDKFFSIIAHDLRNPFHGFLNLTKMLAEETDNFSPEELSKIGNGLYKTANNIFSLLKNLLEWSQMQKGSSIYEPEELSISDLIVANVIAISEMGRQKEITIIYEVTESVNAYADEKMISSVLSNLLWNAVKFTNRNGNVTINSKEIENEMVEISIRDTGVGIGKDMVEKLFTLGEKTNRKGTEGEPSTGLGLLLCKEFVEKNGGKIWVESEEGLGSTFYFTLRSHRQESKYTLT